MKRYNVAIVGATGLVGETMIKVLEERKFPVGELRPLASEGSRGKKIKFCGREIQVQALAKKSFEGIDFALFSAGGDVSLEYAPIAAKAGAIVIDNTSAFRMNTGVPLIVPEVNGEALGRLRFKVQRSKLGVQCSRANVQDAIIANPNCSTIQLVCVLKPIHDAARIKRIVVATYQSVSGAGREAMETLKKGQGPIAFNCVPHIDKFEANGYTKEEMKVINETKKIMGDVSIEIACTAVRVPVMVGHSEAVNIETERHLTAAEVRKILGAAPGIKIIDNPARAEYPLARNAEGRDEVFVGRIREDVSCKNGIDLWIVADNLRKGAATNAVQIAEMMIK